MNRFLVPTPEYVRDAYLRKQQPEVARLLLSPGRAFDWDVITELDLSMTNVQEMVGLRLATNVRRLCAAHNDIRRIEHLDRLTKIEHLDLSHNRIVRVENLGALTALAFLSLRHNRVRALENLDENALLETLLVGGNAIVDAEATVAYAARFDRLRHLDVAGNPLWAADCGSDGDRLRQLFVDRLPRLQYLDGVEIKRPGSVQAPEGEDKEDVGRLDFLTDADGPQFINRLYRDDGIGKLLSKWNSTVRTSFASYAMEVDENAGELYRKILNEQKVRDEISRTFKINYLRLEKVEIEKSRENIRKFEKLRRIRMDTFSGNLEESCDGRSSSDDFKRTNVVKQYSVDVFTTSMESSIDVLGDELLIMNIKRNRYINAIIDKYENILKDEIKAFLDSLVPIFFNMREAENTYSQVLTENVKLVVNNIQKPIPKMFLNKFENRYAIVQAAYKSTDKHLDMIYKREEKIFSDANIWTKNTIDELRKAEQNRFFMVIEEVIKYREAHLAWVEIITSG